MLNKELLLASGNNKGTLTVLFASGGYYPVGWDLYIEGHDGVITKSDPLILDAQVGDLFALKYRRFVDHGADKITGVFGLEKASSGVTLVEEGDIFQGYSHYLRVTAPPAVAYVTFY